MVSSIILQMNIIEAHFYYMFYGQQTRRPEPITHLLEKW